MAEEHAVSGVEGGHSTRGLRSLAVEIVERTLASRAPIEADLRAGGRALSDRDQALLREIVLGTLRWLKRLDQVVLRASGRTFEQIHPALLPVLRVAAYQLLFLDRVPPHAVVSEAVDEALRRSHRGAAGFVNAVLRKIAARPELEAWPIVATDPVERLAIETSHPELLVRRWLSRYGEAETRDLLESNNRPKPMHLLAFRARGGRDLLQSRLLAEGIEAEPSRLSELGLIVRSGTALRSAAFAAGEFYVQDEVAQLVANLPAPRRAERVLDATAAPGGKGLALLAAEPEINLVAADLSLPRIAALVANHRRLQTRASILAADAAHPPFVAAFDRVVVDYPCSGTGTLRKHPELKWRWSQSELDRLARQAVGMLRGASKAVAPLGKLVAISCSLEVEENETVGDTFLAEAPDFRRSVEIAGVSGAALEARCGPGIFRFRTAGEHDGFTLQLFQRVS